MLLNEFLKEHRTVQDQGTEVQQLRQTVAQLKDLVNQLAEQKKGGAQ
jgi:outer membrane murein-binding lipoprotein Lpp